MMMTKTIATRLGLTLAVLLSCSCQPAGESASGDSRAAHADEELTPAPDFTLPDLAGHMHSLSDYRGKKVLLIAYASW